MEFDFSDDDAEAMFQRQAAGPASTTPPQPQPPPFRGSRNAGPSNRQACHPCPCFVCRLHHASVRNVLCAGIPTFQPIMLVEPSDE